ncbi:MAG: hypothetical protein WAK60_03375 [Sedimentisphaerales bacterium]
MAKAAVCSMTIGREANYPFSPSRLFLLFSHIIRQQPISSLLNIIVVPTTTPFLIRKVQK